MTDPESDLSAHLDAEGIPDLEGSPPGMSYEDQLEGMVPPRDTPQGVEEWGITNAEQRIDEPISERVWREEPEPMAGPDDGLDVGLHDDDPLGRIVGSDTDVDSVDIEKQELAMTVDDGPTAQSAEESAMHLTEDPPMGDGDGYVDDAGPAGTGGTP